jgi:hypothetical protein
LIEPIAFKQYYGESQEIKQKAIKSYNPPLKSFFENISLVQEILTLNIRE